MWQAYIPTYLTSLGASGLIVGLFGSCKDLLDSVYRYPDGWLADRVGRRRALLLFTDRAGKYEIADVPSGRYTLVAWSERLKGVKQEVTVESGKILTVDLAMAR